MDKCKKYIQILKSKKLLDSISSSRLQISLQSISRRRTRDSFQRLLGGGDKVKGAIERIVSAVQRRTRVSCDAWKRYVVACNKKEFFDAMRSAKLKTSLGALPVQSVKGCLTD